MKDISKNIRRGIQFSKFSIVAFLGFMVTFTITHILTDIFAVFYLVSFFLGLIIAWGMTFTLNFIFTFDNRSQKEIHQQLFVFVSIYTAIGLINLAIAFFLTSILLIPYMFSISIACTSTALVTFSAVRRLVFRDEPLIPKK